MRCERGVGRLSRAHFALNPADMLCIVQNSGVSEVGHEHFALREVILSRIGQKI